MSIRLSNRTPLVAVASFVLCLGVALGPAEATASAQGGPVPTKKSEKAKKDKDKKKDDQDAAKKEEEEKAATPPPPPAEEEVAKKKEFDASIEASKAVYVSADFGVTLSDLGAVSDKTNFDRTSANGPLYGLSAGLRLKDLRFGARWRVYDTSEFSLWTFALSAGYGLPLRPVSPIFSAHVGYVFDQHVEEALIKSSLPQGTILPPDVDVKGLLAGVDVNASYWVTQFLRLGVFVGADLMFLNRSKVPPPATIFGPPDVAGNPLYNDSGSSIGLNVNFGLRGAFDIGISN